MDPKQTKALSRVLAALLLVASLAHMLPGAVSPVRAAPGDITRVSVSSSEVQANSESRSADISNDARFVVFHSDASNLVNSDTNAAADVFLRDRQSGETFRISVSSSGTQANNGSFSPAISGDGRFITFNSDATNLVNGDTNGFTDIFVRDRQTGTTTRVSIGPNGTQANGSSESQLAISGDGRFVAFYSDATNLVNGDTNDFTDVFVHDRQTGITERISLDSNEVQANNSSFNPSISADGRFVAFTSGANNLVSADTNTRTDVFVRDRATSVTTRVSVNSSGVEANRGGRDASISGNGRYVAFSSDATNLMEEDLGFEHVYVHDRQTGTTVLASIQSDGFQMAGTSAAPSISADGRFVAFEFEDRSDGLAFVAIHLHDRQTGLTIALSGSGGSAEDSSFGPAISGNGGFVAFTSHNRRLVLNDTNEVTDIFVCEVAVTQPVTKTYQSLGDYDGWIIETGEANETGVRIDERAKTFFLGDANNDQQYRSILHFTTASLPNNAIITSVSLKIKRQGIVGENPFTTHGNILVDIRKPYFDTAVELQASDFQAPADRNAVGAMTGAPGASWYTANLDASAFPFINLAGTTQFRLRFALDDNDDHEQDYMKFFSGNAASTDQPVLTINYHLKTLGAPSAIAILRADSNPTVASSRRFTVAFSEPVTGVDTTDFTLITDGSISGVSVTGISGSGDTYIVTIGTGTGSGTIRLDLVDNDSIVDSSGDRLGGNGMGNGNYTSGEVYSVLRPNTDIYLGDVKQQSFHVPPHGSMRLSLAGMNNGPVKLVNTDGTSMMAAERVIYKVNGINTSFTELMGLPNRQLDKTYWLPWYNNVDLDTQLRFANVSDSTASVHVFIGGQEMTGSPFTLAPGASTRQSFAIKGGPVKIESNVNIIVAERLIYKINGVNTSFSETMALPNNQLDTTYWLPWYNNADLDTELRLANVTDLPAMVHVSIGGQEMEGSPFTLLGGESVQKSFAGVNQGPVKVESDMPVVATERVIYKVNNVNTSFSEMMALPDAQLDTTYWLPWYNNKDLDTQLRFANVIASTATVHVYIGGVEMMGSPFTLAQGESTRVSFANINNGPVQIVSDQNIVAAERLIYKVNNINTSFSEMMALPESQLDTTYWFPWYNNKDLDTQLRFAVP